MKIKRLIPLWIFALFIVFLQTAWAAGEAEILLEKQITSAVPVFMPGHPGDLDWIQGYHIEGDNFVKGGATKIGSFTADVSLLNPPMNMDEAYDHAYVSIQNNIPGVGKFQSTGLGVSLGNSVFDGTIMFSWNGSLSNGTASLEDIYGLSGGSATANIFMGTGIMTEVINYRFGY